jgi:hypothetical protein
MVALGIVHWHQQALGLGGLEADGEKQERKQEAHGFPLAAFAQLSEALDAQANFGGAGVVGVLEQCRFKSFERLSYIAAALVECS